MQEIDDATISVIVTSPPYLNNFDYAEMTRMLLYFWGMAESWADITDKVRSRLVVNTTTALNGHKDKQMEYRATLPRSVRIELDEIVSQLADEKKNRRGKKEYDYIPYAYMSQMVAILKECFRCLRKRGTIHVMVADAALYGVHVATPQLIARVMQEIGFKDVTCELVRRRGHRWILSKRDGSARGLGEYYVHAVK
jgi:DNA modification methylase